MLVLATRRPHLGHAAAGRARRRWAKRAARGPWKNLIDATPARHAHQNARRAANVPCERSTEGGTCATCVLRAPCYLRAPALTREARPPAPRWAGMPGGSHSRAALLRADRRRRMTSRPPSDQLELSEHEHPLLQLARTACAHTPAPSPLDMFARPRGAQPLCGAGDAGGAVDGARDARAGRRTGKVAARTSVVRVREGEGGDAGGENAPIVGRPPRHARPAMSAPGQALDTRHRPRPSMRARCWSAPQG
jgi:hypothetical protein